MQVPQNITSAITENSITINWDGVVNADEYEIEVDGIVLDTVSGTSYIHDNLQPNMQHSYRIRAKNSLVKSKWSHIVSDINWSSIESSVVLAANSWIKDLESNNEMEIVLKCNNVTDTYTFEVELEYNPDDLKINAETIKQLFNNEEDIYISYKNIEAGRLKAIISKTGDTEGKTGAFDVYIFRVNLLTEEQTQININSIYIVDSKGNYLEVIQPNELKIKELSEEQRIY
ncbi:MAG: hypothetical protein FH761_15535 [Firmicutes bacterium]|nr:hypothetical protein [Bacillota bacterium]